MGLNLLLILILCLSYHVIYARCNTGKERRPKFPRMHELERSLPTTQGSDFGCVDIYKQPAFEHPLLKNHKVQLWPSFLKRTMERRSLHVGKSFQVDEDTKGCPSGKVPIQKLIMNRQRKTNFLSESQNEKFHMFSKDFPGHHFATLYTTQDIMYHGASATINLFNPPVEWDQFSMALIWLQNGLPAELNSLQIGWAVHPGLYGDNVTRLTSYWTVDGYQKTGCYNVMCPGFVQVHPQMSFGLKFNHMSTIGGAQFGVDIFIKQDQSTGHWWFLTTNETVIGYWPKEIFTHLANGASLISYGGTILASSNEISPPMGSGEFPSEWLSKACFFGRLKIINFEFKEIDINRDDMEIYIDTGSNCYDLLYYGFEGEYFRQAFFFGGPGGQCGT